MDLSVIDTGLVTKLLLLLLIGMGPKIALVPFLEMTKNFDAKTKIAIGKQMVLIALVASLIIFAAGSLLMRLLHITGGAVAVAGGIVLALLALKMAAGPTEKAHEDLGIPIDPAKIAVFPLAVPYLLNPVGITVLILASDEVVSIASAALVVGLILVVAAFDYLVFTNIDTLAKRMKPASLVISEVVFGILLTAVAVQLFVSGLGRLGILTATAAH
jgi:small neutral amino acid transporter SnatA (MarC family)